MKRTILSFLTVFSVIGSGLAQDPNADNTGNNKKATHGSSVTAQDQSNDPADLNITADIRKAVVANEALSALAKNVKIITVKQTVTLRGPVETEKEKATILALAKKHGASKVTDEITIKE